MRVKLDTVIKVWSEALRLYKGLVINYGEGKTREGKTFRAPPF